MTNHLEVIDEHLDKLFTRWRPSRSSGFLGSLDMLFTDIAGQPILPVFKDQIIIFLDCLILEDVTDRLSRIFSPTAVGA